MHGLAHGVTAAASDGVGDDDVRAKRDADEQVEDESGDRRVGTDGGDRRGAVGLGEVADDHDAGCVEELLQNAGRRHGERESQDFRPYAPVQHVYALLVVHHVFASASRSRLVVRFRRHCSGGTKRGNRHAVL